MYWGNHQATISTITNTSTNDMQLSQIPILTAMFTDLNWSNAETTMLSVYQWLLSSPLFRWWPGMSSLSTASTEPLVKSSSTKLMSTSLSCHNCLYQHRPHHHDHHLHNVRLWPGWQAGQHQLHDQEDQGAHPRRPRGPQLQVMVMVLMMVLMMVMMMMMDTNEDPSYTRTYRLWWWWGCWIESDDETKGLL